jgi:hypothetical protein
MNVLTAKSINKIVSRLREELSIYAGEGENRRILISRGNKIKDSDNINYTVDDVLISGDDEVIIKCTRAANPSIMPGETIEIYLTPDELKNNFELV